MPPFLKAVLENRVSSFLRQHTNFTFQTRPKFLIRSMILSYPVSCLVLAWLSSYLDINIELRSETYDGFWRSDFVEFFYMAAVM
jgi:hypothetical protein